MVLKLQTNTEGSWRNFIEFEEGNGWYIRECAAILGSVSENPIKFRIIDKKSGKVLEHCFGPEFVWIEWEGA